MEIYAKKFWLPKRGNTKAEYEDASHFAPDKCRFAVADGATETSFSGAWARQLVRAFAKGSLSVPIAIEELQPLQSRWWETNVHRRSMPWYAEEKAKDGAFAAFIGLELSNENSESGAENTWRATAVGDSCLIHVRRNEILKAFPLAESVFFTNCPKLLCSRPLLNDPGSDVIMAESGSFDRDDIFLLMTDALACWFFRECEEGNQPWNILRGLDTDQRISFEELISDLRSDGRIRNDDVTLVRIDVRG